jgi:cell division protein FtsB
VGGDLATASEKLHKLRTENELLEAEYRTLRSSDGFADRAFSELSMKRPSSVDSIHMDSVKQVIPGFGREQ